MQGYLDILILSLIEYYSFLKGLFKKTDHAYTWSKRILNRYTWRKSERKRRREIDCEERDNILNEH